MKAGAMGGIVLLIFSLSASAQQSDTTPAAGGTLPLPVPHQERPQTGRPRALTNAEVIRMVKAGVPDSAIISSIQSDAVKFDLSPDGLLHLHNAGVDQGILDAMVARGNTAPQPRSSSSSAPTIAAQPGSASSSTSASAWPVDVIAAAGKKKPVALPPMKPDVAKPLPRAQNARAAQAASGVVAALQQQRQLADAEASRMKLAVRPQSQQGTLAGPSQTMSATGSSHTTLLATQAETTAAINGGTRTQAAAQPARVRAAVAPSAGTQRTPALGNAGPLQTSSATGNAPSVSTTSSGAMLLQPIGGGAGTSVPGGGAGPSATGGSAGPSSTGGSNGPSSVGGTTGLSNTGSGGTGGSGTGSGVSNPYAQLSVVNTTAILCVNDPTFRIGTVSGSSSPATFTPIPQYNLYTISGCSFGNPGPADKVYIYGTGSFQANFNINFWSDNSIVVALDPTLTGIPDLNNLTLVVQRGDGQQTQKGGFKFYAVRQTVQLSSIPQSWVKLASFPSAFNTTYTSPSTGSTAGSAFVGRFAGQKFDPSSSTDYYSFSQLSAGFTTDSFQLVPYSVDASCYPVTTYIQNFGNWAGNWAPNGNDIVVSLSDTSCSGFFPPAPWVNYENRTGSMYSLNVWVSGPRGIDPISGNAVQ